MVHPILLEWFHLKLITYLIGENLLVRTEITKNSWLTGPGPADSRFEIASPLEPI